MSNKLGLDLGTQSIGWVVIDSDTNELVKFGSRVLPTIKSRQQNRNNRYIISRAYYRAKSIKRRIHEKKWEYPTNCVSSD